MAPSGPDLDIGRPEVRVAGREDRLELGAGEAGALVLDLVAENALEADHVGDEQVSLELLGEVAAAEELDARGGPGALLVDLGRAGVLVRVVDVAREQRAVGGDRAGAVDHDVLAPAVEGVAVGVGEAVGDVNLELLRLRLVAEDPRVRAADRRAVRRLDLGLVERSLLKIKGAAGVELEAVGGVVRVGRIEAGEDSLADVGLVVAVGVLQEHQVGRLGDQDAAVGELEAGRAMQAVGEDDPLVGLAVAVGVFEDQELVVHFLLGLPVRVGRPAGDPEAALGVERHLHRLGQLGKLLLGGEQVDLEVLADASSGRWLPRRSGRDARRWARCPACWS